MIGNEEEIIDLEEYTDSYLDKEIDSKYSKTTIEFTNLISLTIPKNNHYIPQIFKCLGNLSCSPLPNILLILLVLNL